MSLIRTIAAGTLALGLLASAASAAEPVSITAALADKARPKKAMDLDATRRTAEVLAFAGIRPGDKVADLMPGAGYYTLLFSDLVGSAGTVYAVVPAEFLKFGPRATDGVKALQPDYRNVVVSTPPINAFAAAEPLDIVWTSWNYHDLHDSFMGPADVAGVNAAVFRALKPGGTFLIIDHRAATGSGLRDTESLHRIDLETVKSEVTAAGFVLDSASTVLANPDDTHALNVFKSEIRGHTDTFILKFRKPKG
jgi:predicted methyltransferase